MIAGLILAAGGSERMGEPKALLTINGKTFLRHIVETLESARVMKTTIVLGAYAEQIRASLDWYSGHIVLNNRWQEGQLSSIITGIESLAQDDVHGVLLCPVDHPCIAQELLVDMLYGFWKSGKHIVIPTYQGKRGHPVIFSKELFQELCSAPHTEGAKSVVRNHGDDIMEIPVDEEGILLNVDTPSDYRMLLERMQK